jgi:aminoglycoside 6'-N-acetyltransferase I
MDERCYLTVAEVRSNIIGLLSAYRFPDLVSGGQLVYLYEIEGEVAQRRKGVGRSLIQCLITHCETDNVDRIWAGTAIDTNSARTLFADTGASLAGESYAEFEWNLRDRVSGDH